MGIFLGNEWFVEIKTKCTRCPRATGPVALSFHGSPARVALLLQAARGRHAQLQARGVDDLGPGAIQAEIPFERVDDVVERRRLAPGLYLYDGARRRQLPDRLDHAPLL